MLQFGMTWNSEINIHVSPNKWCDLYWIDSWRFVYSPSLSDCSTIIDDDLDSELEFLASASSVMVNPVLPYTRDVLTQLAPLQMHFLSLFDAQCLIQCTLFRVSLHMHPLKIWGKFDEFDLILGSGSETKLYMETKFWLRIQISFLNVYVAIQNAEGSWSMLLGSTKWSYYTFIC